jgi:hypothetical protein
MRWSWWSEPGRFGPVASDHDVPKRRGGDRASSGNGFGYGTVSNADLFSEWQWIMTRSQIPTYLF